MAAAKKLWDFAGMEGGKKGYNRILLGWRSKIFIMGSCWYERKKNVYKRILLGWKEQKVNHRILLVWEGKKKLFMRFYKYRRCKDVCEISLLLEKQNVLST